MQKFTVLALLLFVVSIATSGCAKVAEAATPPPLRSLVQAVQKPGSLQEAEKGVEEVESLNPPEEPSVNTLPSFLEVEFIPVSGHVRIEPHPVYNKKTREMEAAVEYSIRDAETRWEVGLIFSSDQKLPSIKGAVVGRGLSSSGEVFEEGDPSGLARARADVFEKEGRWYCAVSFFLDRKASKLELREVVRDELQ